MRDGRRQRLGIGGTTTATLNAGEDPGRYFNIRYR